MNYTKHFLKGIDSVLLPTLDPFRFPSPITPLIQPHFLAALKYLRSSYGTEMSIMIFQFVTLSPALATILAELALFFYAASCRRFVFPLLGSPLK